MTDMLASVGDWPSLGSAWYSTRSPPSRSRPSLVTTGRHEPSADELSGNRRFGKKSMRRARTPIRRIRAGPALRIEAGCYTERPSDAVTGSGLQGRLDPLGERPPDAGSRRD